MRVSRSADQVENPKSCYCDFEVFTDLRSFLLSWAPRMVHLILFECPFPKPFPAFSFPQVYYIEFPLKMFLFWTHFPKQTTERRERMSWKVGQLSIQACVSFYIFSGTISLNHITVTSRFCAQMICLKVKMGVSQIRVCVLNTSCEYGWLSLFQSVAELSPLWGMETSLETIIHL